MDDDDDLSPDASPSPASSAGADPVTLPVADPVTVASAPPGGGAYPVALPIHRTAASLYATAGGGGGGGGGGREDAWSEGATSALIDAWGERFVALGRGSLRHPQWQEVADAVSSSDGYSKAPKSDVQCKNRIDTLKKKYKIERAKPASSWQFFDRLDFLLAPTYGNKPGSGGGGGGGGGHNSNNSRSPVPAALRVGFPQRSRTPLMHAAAAAAKRRAPSPEPSVSSESSDGFPPVPALPAVNGKKRRTDEGRANGGSGGDRTQGLRDLAQAIRRLGEAYERVEAAKLEQAAEMERRRIDFARDLESQRGQFFLNTQMELTQAKNHASPAGATTVGGSSRRMSMAADAGGSSNHHHSRYQISHGDRHHHALRPHYQQYHENNHAAAAAAASDGEQSEEEDNEEEEEEESQ
ncbi:Trihelix transcription factor ASIL2 [Dichanthelium oligosanthes]|uniref:Trihelix transcription factor ASIL2 n=1 Tax=Dichanthelium oligosanthes TaxID=888268 RepID=A0A1E5V6A4_9POAL|nr:Trihelix transcription factor ASIL2 [Dichanthelium oligosanthes]